MDKETLSHYGLILMSLMIVSVLIVFATPFGDYKIKQSTPSIGYKVQNGWG